MSPCETDQEEFMLKRWAVISVIAVAVLMGYLIASNQPSVQGQGAPASAAAVPSDIGNMDLTGPYEPVAD